MSSSHLNRPGLQAIGHLLVGCLSVLFFAGRSHAQYLLETGAPTFTVAEPVEVGFVNVANGNLHIEIPLASVPQRGGHTFVAKIVYDSRIWKIVNTGGSQSWQPTNVPDTQLGNPSRQLGWRFLTTTAGTATYDQTTYQCYSGGTPYNWYKYQNYRLNDPDGTVRRFALYYESSNICHTAGPTTTSGPSLDATGYRMDLAYGYYVTQVVASDGTRVYSFIPGSTETVKDPNGNFFNKDPNGNAVDTLNRTVVQKTDIYNDLNWLIETDYTLPTSQGSSTFKVFYTAFIPIQTSFGVPGVTEYSGTLQTVSRIEMPDGSYYYFGYETAPEKYGLLKYLILPTGETVSFTHANFQGAQGNKNRWLSTVSKGGGQWTFAPATCGANCNKVTVSRPSGDDTVYTFNLNNGAWNTQTKYHSGSAGSGTLLETLGHDYDYSLTNPVAGGAGFIRRTRTTTTMPGPGGDLVKKSELTYDTFTYSYRGANYTGSRGNVLTSSEFAYGSGGAGSLTRKTLYNYLHDANPDYTPKNIVKRVTAAETQDGAGVKRAETLTSYDSTTLTSMTGITHHDDTNFGVSYSLRGNPTAIQRWIGTGYVSTTLNYDTTGQVVSAIDPKGNTTSFSYANNFYLDNGQNPPTPASAPAANAYVTQVTLPVSGTRAYGYYYNSGKQTLATDQNGSTEYFHFQDVLDRPTATYGPGQAWTQTQYTGTTQRDYFTSLSDSSTRQDRSLLDGLARPQRQSLLTDPQGTTYVDTAYDTSGRTQSVTNPYRSTGDPTYGQNTYLYDGLSRVTRVTHADGQYTQTFYGSAVGGAGGATFQLCAAGTYGLGYPTLFKDEAGKKRQAWTDALGRAIEVDEPDATGTLTLGTCYAYDVLGNLIEVDQGSQTRVYTYDALGRLASDTTPEAGTVSVYYTDSGGALCSGDPSAVCRRMDSRGITTTYAYDAENRLAGKTYSNGDPTVSYFYDQTSYNGLTITNGRGRRTGLSDGSGQAAWSYDVEGRVLTEKRTLFGVTKTISRTYNRDGSLNRLTYPSGQWAQHYYDTAQRITQISYGTTAYVTYATYGPQGALASASYGVSNPFPGGMNATYSYNRRLQPSTMRVTHTNGTVVLLDFTYNFLQGSVNNGNVVSIANNLTTGRTQSFTYDELNRTATAQSQANSGADCWGQSFGYDRYANLLTATVTKCTAPALSLSVNNQNQITNPGFTYDAAGNLTGDALLSYAWNAESRLSSTAGVDYSYDGDGQRVKKSNGTLYWYGPAGEVLAETDLAGNNLREYIYFAGRRIARREASGTVYYYFQDHLGSSRVMTDSQGVVVQESDYYPFGGERVVTGGFSEKFKFAGTERDTESGLDHTLYRKYAWNLGRWLSPDPEGCGVDNPQALNRYVYVVDNPSNLVDPLGLQGCPSWDPFAPGCGDEYPAGGCSNPFYATTHAECGPDRGRYNPQVDLFDIRQALREAREESRFRFCWNCIRNHEKPVFFGLCTYTCTRETPGSFAIAVFTVGTVKLTRECGFSVTTKCPYYLEVCTPNPQGNLSRGKIVRCQKDPT